MIDPFVVQVFAVLHPPSQNIRIWKYYTTLRMQKKKPQKNPSILYMWQLVKNDRNFTDLWHFVLTLHLTSGECWWKLSEMSKMFYKWDVVLQKWISIYQGTTGHWGCKKPGPSFISLQRQVLLPSFRWLFYNIYIVSFALGKKAGIIFIRLLHARNNALLVGTDKDDQLHAGRDWQRWSITCVKY